MGLGLFLARAVIEGVGGSLEIDSAPGGGTSVQVRLPTDVGGRSGVPAASSAVRSRESTVPPVLSKQA
jgi:signal transduction histidine kinase